MMHRRYISYITTMIFFALGRRVIALSIGRHSTAAAVRGRAEKVVSHHNFMYKTKCNQQFGTASLFSTTNGGGSTGEEYDWDTLLPFEKHSHNSLKITVDESPDDDDTKNDAYDLATFKSKLQATLATAEELHKTAIWITIPISRATLIEEASKVGFQFHHAEGTIATLCKWLIVDQESRIPTFATHQVGVGAVVINKSNEILCVREKRNNYRPWKIPGGLAELGEHLDEAAVREVYEETGIKCAFKSVLAVRHTHKQQFGRSDLYFICKLEPISDENEPPVPQEGEIEAVSWLPLDEYRKMVHSKDSNIGHPMMSRVMDVVDSSSEIERMIVPSIVPGRKHSPLYHAPIGSSE